jgi:hypothetical protein
MKLQKNSILTLAFLLFSAMAFCQRSDIFYSEFMGKNNSFSMNYDRKLFKFENNYGGLYGHVGIGKMSSQEVIATKFIKAPPNNPNSGSLGLDLFLFFLFFERDKTIERKQFFNVTNYNIGGKILLGTGKINGIIGLDARIDHIRQTIEPWENIPNQTKNFSNVALSPSVGLRWNKDHFMAQILLAPQTTYGNKKRTYGVVNVGMGFQF